MAADKQAANKRRKRWPPSTKNRSREIKGSSYWLQDQVG